MPRPIPLVATLALALLAAPLRAAGGAGQARSYLTRPLYLGAEAPECRSLRRILVAHAEAETPLSGAGRSRGEALARARELAAELAAGADFAELWARASDERRPGGVLGTFPPGVLEPRLERFLWAAAPWEVSAPIEGPSGIELVQRIDRFAGCRAILVPGQDEQARTRALGILERARGGEDLAELACALSGDPASAARGGDFAVFERGAHDTLLKAAVFEAGVGELVGPVPSPLGFFVAQRVPASELDPALREDNWVRARAILVAHADVPGPRALAERSPAEARELAFELFRRITAGEDMAELARRYDDDLDGPRRAGDLGWLYRPSPHLVSALDRAFLARPGELLEPLPLEIGWLLLRRER